jgi:hypothetical protein
METQQQAAGTTQKKEEVTYSKDFLLQEANSALNKLSALRRSQGKQTPSAKP